MKRRSVLIFLSFIHGPTTHPFNGFNILAHLKTRLRMPSRKRIVNPLRLSCAASVNLLRLLRCHTSAAPSASRVFTALMTVKRTTGRRVTIKSARLWLLLLRSEQLVKHSKCTELRGNLFLWWFDQVEVELQILFVRFKLQTRK